MFFKKKKLLEMDSKMDSIISLIQTEHEMLGNLDNRVNVIEKRQEEICKEVELISQSNESGFRLADLKMEELIQQIKEQIVKNYFEIINLEKENIVLLTEKIEALRNDGIKSIENSNEAAKKIAIECCEKAIAELKNDMERQNSVSKELSQNVEMIGSEIQMLLLNSVMEQM